MNTTERRLQDLASVVVAIILIAIGLLFLADQWLNLGLAKHAWPFFIIIPGVLLFALALRLNEPEGEGFAIFASIVTMTGLVLLFQNITNLWATWAYAWALVAPAAVGLGMMLFGTLKGRERTIQSGREVAKVGLWLFVCFGAFFELVFNISGLSAGRWGIPLLLIVLGLYMMWRTVRRRS